MSPALYAKIGKDDQGSLDHHYKDLGKHQRLLMVEVERTLVSGTPLRGTLDLGAAEHKVGLVSTRSTMIPVTLTLYKVSMTVVLDEKNKDSGPGYEKV